MSCLSVYSMLDLFVEELLTPSRRAAVKSHLSTCATCREHADLLRPAKAAPITAPSSLKNRLRQALASAPAGTAASPVPWGGDGRGAALALTVFATALFALHFIITPNIAAERPVTAAVEPWRLP